MSEPVSIDLDSPGEYTIIAGEPRVWITVTRVLLTVVSPDNSPVAIWGKSGSEVRLGPFYMINGGTLSFARETIPLMSVDVGDPLVIELTGATGKLGGTIIIERGQV
jgi:hypothetical protein